MFQQYQAQGPPRRPVDKEVVNELPEVTLDITDIEGNNSGCAVCQDDWRVGDRGVKLPCGHIYHKQCIMPWIKEHNTCPVCRYEMKTSAQGNGAGSAYERDRAARMAQRSRHSESHSHSHGDESATAAEDEYSGLSIRELKRLLNQNG